MCKSYKDFEKIYIGFSDVAGVIARSVGTVGEVHFGKDDAYSAYECFGEVEIGSHYTKVFSGKAWLTIYDDAERVYHKHPAEWQFVDIYRAGESGCIIHWHNKIDSQRKTKQRR